MSGTVQSIGQSVLSEQASRIQTATDGTVTWTYSTAFASGTIPNVQAMAEYTEGSTNVVNVQLDGPPTNIIAKFRVNRSVPTSLIGSLLGVLAGTPGAIWLQVRACG